MARSTFIPSNGLGKAGFAALVALAGTTISPYLFFWQATEETDDEAGHAPDVSPDHLRAMRGDVAAGMASAVFAGLYRGNCVLRLFWSGSSRRSGSLVRCV